MKYTVLCLCLLALSTSAFADPPWSEAVKAADVGDTINEGESDLAFHGDCIYCICNVSERADVPVIPYGRSTDAGRTWTTTWWVDSTGPSLWHSDPIILADDTGYVHMFIQFSSILIRHYLSVDSGQTWIDTVDVTVSGRVDKPWACYFGNEIYICWQDLSSGSRGIWFGKSTDCGRNWSLQRIDFRTYLTGIDVSPSGILYVVLRSGTGLHVFKSTDAGETWPDSLKKTLDNQVSYSDGYGDRAPLACIAAPTDDNVFVTVVDDRHGNWDILYSRSTDAGETWTPLAILNDSTAGGQCKGWVEADPYARLHFLWYHTPSWPTSAASWWSVRYQYSEDFGATISPSIRLNDTVFRSVSDFLGEYHIIETDSNVARCVWTDGREGDNDLWFAEAELDSVGISENPFKVRRPASVWIQTPTLSSGPDVTVRFGIRTQAHARLEVFDALGRNLRTVDLGFLEPGLHQARLSGLPRDQTLFVRLEAGETLTRKVQLLD